MSADPHRPVTIFIVLEGILYRIRTITWIMAAASLALSACTATTPAAAPAAVESPAAAPVNVQPVKDYTLQNGETMKTETQALADTADAYYTLIESYQFDYARAWNERSADLAPLVAQAKERWLAASTAYEVNEGIIARLGTPARFDVWIDAGPSGAEDPAEAYAWTLELPDGTRLEQPGNLFHSLLEPTLWGALLALLASGLTWILAQGVLSSLASFGERLAGRVPPEETPSGER